MLTQGAFPPDYRRRESLPGLIPPPILQNRPHRTANIPTQVQRPVADDIPFGQHERGQRFESFPRDRACISSRDPRFPVFVPFVGSRDVSRNYSQKLISRGAHYTNGASFLAGAENKTAMTSYIIWVVLDHFPMLLDRASYLSNGDQSLSGLDICLTA